MDQVLEWCEEANGRGIYCQGHIDRIMHEEIREAWGGEKKCIDERNRYQVRNYLKY